jgi:hypothetical protein
MLELALWLKENGFRADQVQAFLPSPMATATAMWHSGKDPLHKVTRTSPEVFVPKKLPQRRLHKAFLRYHDANNWPLLREALRRMGRADLIGSGKRHLVPAWQPKGTGGGEGMRSPAGGARRILTQHSGLPPRDDGSARPPPRTGPARPATLGPQAGQGAPRRGPKAKTGTPGSRSKRR